MARPRPKRSTLPDGSVVVAGKRANGVGSTYYVASRGVWRSTWVDPTTGRRRSVNSATRAEAEKRAATKAIPQLEAAAGEMPGLDVVAVEAVLLGPGVKQQIGVTGSKEPE